MEQQVLSSTLALRYLQVWLLGKEAGLRSDWLLQQQSHALTSDWLVASKVSDGHQSEFGGEGGWVQCSRSRRRTGTAKSGRVLVGDEGSGSEFVGSASWSVLAARRGGAGVDDRSWHTSYEHFRFCNASARTASERAHTVSSTMSVPSSNDTVGHKRQCSSTLVSWERRQSTSSGLPVTTQT